MKIGYICNDCGREISSDEFDHRESIICPECGSYYARNIPKAWCFPDINGQLQGPLCKDDIQNLLDEGQITEQTEILNLDSSERRSFAQWESLQWVKQLPPETSEDPPEKSAPKLTECPQCSSMVSLRATKCPKCEAVLKERCLVCSSMIPIGSSLCPQCGDPFPYQVAKTDTIICPNCCKERYTARDLCGHCREPLPDFLRETIPHLLHCIFCNQTLSEQAKECPHCKTSTSQPCQICGKVVSCWSQECPECGDPEPFNAGGSIKNYEHLIDSLKNKVTTNLSNQADLKIRNKQFSWGSFGVAFLIAFLLNILLSAAVGVEPSKNIIWTVFWIYLTIESWKFWQWKALLPYPLFLIVSFFSQFILASTGTDRLSWGYIAVMLITNIGGLTIFYMLYRKSQKETVC